MFHKSILQVQEELKYHQSQQEQLEQQLYALKSYEEFAAQAFDNVKDAIEQIQDPKYLELFKEGLLSLFPPTNTPLKEINSDPISKEKKEKEFGSLSYYELTGRPDTRPDTYEDLAPNIVYSSSGRAYVGFNDQEEAEKFSNSISEPSMIGDTETMNGYEYEVKFYCDRSYIEELLVVSHQLDNNDFEQDEDWTPEQKEELNWQEQLVRITPDIFYDPSTSKCFVGFTNYQRATTYGAHLKEIHELYDSRYSVDKPTVVTNCKHELVIECITEENASKLAPLNLKKELDHRVNKAVTDTWILPLEKEETAPISATSRCASRPRQCDRRFGEDELPAPPYEAIPLDQVELCDIVTTSANAQSAYEVTSNLGTHLLATCLYNHSLKHREGQKDFWITEAYLIQKGDEVPIAS